MLANIEAGYKFKRGEMGRWPRDAGKKRSHVFQKKGKGNEALLSSWVTMVEGI